METKPEVTVMIPTLNEELGLETLLDDLADQTHPPAQVLRIDGGSTDGTIEIASNYKRLDIEVLNNPQRRVPFALNIGLDAAKFDYLIRIDAHSRINPEYIEVIAGHFAADPAIGGVGGIKKAVATSRAGQIIADVLSSKLAVGGSQYHYAEDVCFVDHIPFGAYPVSVLRELDGWDEAMLVNQDYELDYRVRQSGRRLLIDPKARIMWQSRETVARLFHQYHRYGQGKAAVLKKHPSSGKPRHLLPAVIVVGCVVGALGAFIWPVLAIVPLGYLLAVGIVSATIVRSPGKWPTAVGAMLAMQLGYGSGMVRSAGSMLRGRRATMAASQTSDLGRV